MADTNKINSETIRKVVDRGLEEASKSVQADAPKNETPVYDPQPSGRERNTDRGLSR